MIKILILVQSSDNYTFKEIRQAQIDTWDSIKVKGVSTYYYLTTKYELMHYDFKKTLDSVWNLDWDIIFRTSASTYVRKDRLREWVDKNYKPMMYEGVLGGTHVSGVGIIMTRDIADLVRNGLKNKEHLSEDIAISEVLIKHGIKPTESTFKRLQFNFQEDKILDADYYRCKSEIKLDGTYGTDVRSEGLDRSYDIKAMKQLHKHIYGI